MSDSHTATRTRGARRRWRNWGGNQQCVPATVARPTTLDDLFHMFEATGVVLGMHTFPAHHPPRTARPLTEESL